MYINYTLSLSYEISSCVTAIDNLKNDLIEINKILVTQSDQSVISKNNKMKKEGSVSRKKTMGYCYIKSLFMEEV